MGEQDRVARAEQLFAAWSSGEPDAPAQHLTPDAVLFDVIGGEYRGWPAIREYFAHGLTRYPDLELVPTGEFWHRDDGLALTWVMSATNHNPDFGAETVGRKWRAEGMSYLVFDGDLVCGEYDYHDGGSRQRSLTAER